MAIIDSLCWSCGTPFEACSWMNEFVPVKGWEAQEHKIEPNDFSYTVISCPKFTYNGICAKCLYYKDGKFLKGCRRKELQYSDCSGSHNKFIIHD